MDLRLLRRGLYKSRAKFTELAANFAAAIRGMPKEDLLSEEVRQQRRALRLAVGAAAALFLLMIAAAAAGFLAYRAQQEALRNFMLARASRRQSRDRYRSGTSGSRKACELRQCAKDPRHR